MVMRQKEREMYKRPISSSSSMAVSATQTQKNKHPTLIAAF